MSEIEEGAAIRVTVLVAIISRFDLGRVVITPGAAEALEWASVDIVDLVRRHGSGDWGDLSEDDRKTNDEAIQNGNRILSSYVLSTGAKVWLITEADRSVSTLLLPDEY